MPGEKSNHIHFGFLDSVRGLAALFVVIGHSFDTPGLGPKCGMNDIFRTIQNLTTPCALSLFFLLSSFLLTFRLHSDLQKALSLKELSLTICKLKGTFTYYMQVPGQENLPNLLSLFYLLHYFHSPSAR